MTDTKELMRRIAALRLRLTAPPETEEDPARAIAARVAHGAEQAAQIDVALRSALPADAPFGGPVRLCGRGVRLLRKGRELLQALRTIADDPDFHDPEGPGTFEQIHREALAMIDTVLRTVQAFPKEMTTQMRLCDGLEIVLDEVERRVSQLNVGMENRNHASTQINQLTECLNLIASKKPIGLAPLQAVADAVIADAQAGLPLRVLYAPPRDPARFAASHGLTTAQVLVRILMNDREWQPQLQLAAMAALVHDVGMTCVPVKLLCSKDPLNADDRRLIEKHTSAGEVMLAKLWPGGGWPVEAAAQHHERNDGAGYPLGEKATRLSSFARLIAVCDVYAALLAPRPYRPAFDTRTALTETLLLAERDYLDKTFVERLLLLTFYPVGTAVELNDGAVGFVLETPPAADGLTPPDRPIVHVVQGGSGPPHTWPSVVDLRATKERRIVRALSASERCAKLGRRFPQLL